MLDQDRDRTGRPDDQGLLAKQAMGGQGHGHQQFPPGPPKKFVVGQSFEVEAGPDQVGNRRPGVTS